MNIVTVRLARVGAALALVAGLAACMSDRPPLGLPDARVVTFDGRDALPPDCRALGLPSGLRDPDLHEHPVIPFGCATYSNLAAQLARPADAVSPENYAGPDGGLAARAVQRFESRKSETGSDADTASKTTTTTSMGQ